MSPLPESPMIPFSLLRRRPTKLPARAGRPRIPSRIVDALQLLRRAALALLGCASPSLAFGFVDLPRPLVGSRLRRWLIAREDRLALDARIAFARELDRSLAHLPPPALPSDVEP